jgi:hypothetical protein
MVGLLAILAVIGLIAGSIYFCIGTIMLAIGAHFGAGRIWVLYGAWILAIPVLLALIFGLRATGAIGESSRPVFRPATIELTLADPLQGSWTGGSAQCYQPNGGAPVSSVASTNSLRQGSLSASISFRVVPSGNPRVDLWVVLSQKASTAPADSARPSERRATYFDLEDGHVVRQTSPDGNSGQIELTNLGHATDHQFDGDVFPPQISGTLYWICGGADSTLAPSEAR